MKQESIDQSKIKMFSEYHGLRATDPPQQSSKEQQQNIPSKEDLMNDSVLAKYIKMTKVGVPVQAVCSKMNQDKVDLAKIHMFNLAFGLVKAKSPKRSPIPTALRTGRRASTALQKIHWNTVADEHLLKNSVWAAHNDDSELDESDIEKLEALFALAQTNRAAAVAAKKNMVKKDTKKRPSLIDPKRANNIAISLAQFRNFQNFDDLVSAVVTLNGQHLSLEKLMNMKLLLPQKEEISRLQQYNMTEVDGLGQAEKFFVAVMKAPRFSQKLGAFIFSLQFEEMTSTLSLNLHTLSQACQEVTRAKKLALILRRFLAIGNVMNESAGKPIASGITLDSLIKTAKMKGSDGRTTVLDSVITSRLELASFRNEMPTMRDAMRLDLADLSSNLREIESGVNGVELAIKAEKEDVDSSDDGLISESSERFLQKLEPFHKHVTKEIESIKSKFDHVEECVQSLCSFFAEDSNTKVRTAHLFYSVH
jgi:diaphanous 1